MRDWQSLIKPGDNPTLCAYCNACAVVTGDGSGRKVCLACAMYDRGAEKPAGSPTRLLWCPRDVRGIVGHPAAFPRT